MMKSICIFLLLVVMLVGCSHHVIKPIHDTNLVDFTGEKQYQIIGKMSFSNGEDGGSGRVNWQYNEGFVTVVLKAPLGSRSWELEEYESGAKIETNKGYIQYSDSAQALVSQELGWSVPWDELKQWIKGKPYQSVDADIKAHNDGYDIREKGWEIKYSKMKSYGIGELPMKIVARKNNYAIKISIKKWNW